MKFIHTADLQLGSRMSQFGARSEALRDQRFLTLEKILQLCEDERVDACIIAGDIFEDNQVDSSVIRKFKEILDVERAFPLLLCPGNHDPQSGPGSIWYRTDFSECKTQVHVFNQPGIFAVERMRFIGAPLQQKKSTQDPSSVLVQLVNECDPNDILIGITHGSPAIPGKHQPDDFPISLTARLDAGLDYLALGHWHGWFSLEDERMVMPGTPEPDSFAQTNSGYLAIVEFESKEKCHIERVSVGALKWIEKDVDLSTTNADLITSSFKSDQVVKLRLNGVAETDVILSLDAEIEKLKAQCFALVVHDESYAKLSVNEWKVICENSPVLQSVINDLEILQNMVDDRTTGSDSLPLKKEVETDFQSLAAQSKIDWSQVDRAFIRRMSENLMQSIREA